MRFIVSQYSSRAQIVTDSRGEPLRNLILRQVREKGTACRSAVGWECPLVWSLALAFFLFGSLPFGVEGLPTSNWCSLLDFKVCFKLSLLLFGIRQYIKSKCHRHVVTGVRRCESWDSERPEQRLLGLAVGACRRPMREESGWGPEWKD